MSTSPVKLPGKEFANLYRPVKVVGSTWTSTTSFPPGTHVRIHPLLDWTEINIWEYIKLEHIPFMDLYLNKGCGTRYRSLGCAPCTTPIQSTATTVDEIIEELRNSNVAERAGRAQDEGRGMELLRKDGYM